MLRRGWRDDAEHLFLDKARGFLAAHSTCALGVAVCLLGSIVGPFFHVVEKRLPQLPFIVADGQSPATAQRLGDLPQLAGVEPLEALGEI